MHWSCGLSGEREEEAHGETVSVVRSAILYLNGDFDGGAFYFTELDAKTVTVSVPSGLSLGDRNPHGAVGRVARAPLLNPGAGGGFEICRSLLLRPPVLSRP